MQIGGVSSYKAQTFKSNREYENPVSRNTEKHLAILANVAGSTVLGAIAGGITSTFTKGWRTPVGAGAGVALLALLITLPAKLYNTKVNAFVKQKEMDVFTRDRALKTNLTEDVINEVKDEDVSLDKKLDDNLKLQMANKGTALGLANISPQAQG